MVVAGGLDRWDILLVRCCPAAGLMGLALVFRPLEEEVRRVRVERWGGLPRLRCLGVQGRRQLGCLRRRCGKAEIAVIARELHTVAVVVGRRSRRKCIGQTAKARVH